MTNRLYWYVALCALLLLIGSCVVSPYFGCDGYSESCYAGAEGRLQQDFYIGRGGITHGPPATDNWTTSTTSSTMGDNSL